MIITAVQESSVAGRRSRVLIGEPLRRVSGKRGPIALFAPGVVVAYRMERQRYATGCVFRTTNSVSCVALGGVPVPGVRPAPVLLIGFLRGRLFDRAVQLLHELRRRGVVDALDNSAYLRAAFALGRPEFYVQVLADALEDSWTS